MLNPEGKMKALQVHGIQKHYALPLIWILNLMLSLMSPLAFLGFLNQKQKFKLKSLTLIFKIESLKKPLMQILFQHSRLITKILIITLLFHQHRIKIPKLAINRLENLLIAMMKIKPPRMPRAPWRILYESQRHRDQQNGPKCYVTRGNRGLVHK